MNLPAATNTDGAAAFVAKILRWYPGVKATADWSKAALDMLAPYGPAVLARLEPIAQRQWQFGFPSIPALRQAIDATLAHMERDSMDAKAREERRTQLMKPDERKAEQIADKWVRDTPDAVADGWWWGLWDEAYNLVLRGHEDWINPKRAQKAYYRVEEILRAAADRTAAGAQISGDDRYMSFAQARAERRAIAAARLGIKEERPAQSPAPAAAATPEDDDALSVLGDI